MKEPTLFQGCQADCTEVRELCDLVRENTSNVLWMIRLGKWAVGLTGAIVLLAIAFGTATIQDIRSLETRVAADHSRLNMVCDKVFGKHYNSEGEAK